MVENFNCNKTRKQILRVWVCICLVPKSVEWEAGLALLCELLPSIHSDEGLTLEMSAFQFLYGGQFTLSTLLINQVKGMVESDGRADF